MKKLIIVCEGPTEVEFCKDVLQSYFFNKKIDMRPVLIKKSGGGTVSWSRLKSQIEMHLYEGGFYVTTLIDFYGIEGKHKFPKWDEAKGIDHKSARMDFLEMAMVESVAEELRDRFIPYIQLHEFEGLLFNNIEVFSDQIPSNEFTNFKELQRTIEKYPNPEMINDGYHTCPGRRLGNLITGYNKIVYGSILAEAIGLGRIRSKSPRFNQWIENLEQI